mgnify:FL=1|tara:strand:- start:3565 stop:3780 length:216 start_codon:yes stop_codon:yes gene_type:complete
MKNVLILLLGLLFISCDDEDSSSPCKTDKIDDMACIEIYQPVCGCNNETYSNSCYAEVDGVTSWSEGECSG